MITKKELDKKIDEAKVQEFNLDDIEFDKKAYSRTRGVDNSAIQDYSYNKENLPPIIITKCFIYNKKYEKDEEDNIKKDKNGNDVFSHVIEKDKNGNEKFVYKIVDGVHRYKAHQRHYQELEKKEKKKEKEEKQKINKNIKVKVIDIEENDIKLANLILDLRNGVRHPENDIKQVCIDRWSPNYEEKKLLWTELGISESTFYEYTKNLQKDHKEQVYRSVINDLLKVPELTQQEIAERNGYSKNVRISEIKNALLTVFPDFGKKVKTDENELFYDILYDYHNFINLSKENKEIYLYNIWNTPKGDNKEYFGHFPKIFMKNLLYYHTEPFDIVYDPFAGSGTMIDACYFMFRKCLASDRKPLGDRTDEILEWDIKDGLPEELPNKTKMVFLDPPYWKQAENKYSEDKEDLANMSLEDFNNFMNKLLNEITKKKIEKIAIVISPTQWPSENHKFIDHIRDFDKMIGDKYEIEMEYELPYSTEQYNGNQVTIAKEMRIPLNLKRKLWVWSRK